VLSQQQLSTVPQHPLDDRLMQSWMADALVTNLADVNGIGKQFIESIAFVRLCCDNISRS
jgi:hypothetical protein